MVATGSENGTSVAMTATDVARLWDTGKVARLYHSISRTYIEILRCISKKLFAQIFYRTMLDLRIHNYCTNNVY